MAVPKRRKTKRRRDQRRANHDRIAKPTVVDCPACGAPSVPHRVCAACGQYKGRQIIEGAET